MLHELKSCNAGIRGQGLILINQRDIQPFAQGHLMLQVVRAVLQNVHMALESHLHQLIPVTLTCLVAKNLGGSPAEDHWSLRDAAAALVGLVIARFGSEYPDIQMRISRQLLKAFLDPARPLATHYGARPTSGRKF